MASCPRLRLPWSFCRRAIFTCRSDGAAGGPFLATAVMAQQRFSSLGLKSRITARWRSFPGKNLQRFPNCPPQIKNHCRTEVVFRQNHAAIPKSGLEIKNHCTLETVNRQKLASIRKSGLEIKNRCTQEGLNGEIPASIRKSEPKIRNHCSRETVSRQKPAVIPKSGLEIKNHCSRLISFSRGNTSEVPRFGGTGQGREFRRGGLCG